ncbi:TonB family protein [candidate division WOR-3 bacterium]|nr:TonB family protein [candidate division WOR-3 bacterium]
MKTLSITFNPLAWLQSLALALRNTFVELAQILRNPRLWIGIGASLLVHGAIILLSLEYNNKAVAEDPNKIWEVYISPGTEHPNVTKVLGPAGKPAGIEEGINRPIKSTVADQLQALTKNTIDPTDVSALEPHGVMVLARHQLSIADILEREPLAGIRSKGGVVLPGIPILGGPIDPTKHTEIVSPVVKPTSKPAPSPIKEPMTNNKNLSPFSLEGELSPEDIVSTYLPRYPNFAKAKGLNNVVIIVDFSVNPQGDVSPTMIIRRSTGYPNWDADVKATLKRWKFTPSEKLKRTGRITFRFVLD